MSAQRTVNQTCLIALCLSATSSAPCGAGVDLTAEVCFRLLHRRPKHPFPDVRVERVEVCGFQVIPHNLRPNLMILVCRVSEPFSNDESWSSMAVVARLVVAQPVARPEAKQVRQAQPSCKE